MTPSLRTLLAIPVIASTLAGAGCGGSSGSSTKSPSATAAATGTAARRNPKSAAPKQTQNVRVTSIGQLPAAVQDAGVAALPDGRVVLLGGLTPADTSTAAVTVIDGSHAAQVATLPVAQHDAQAALIAGDVYDFGGGQFATYDHILRFDPSGRAVTRVGTLPAPASDVAVATLDGTAYIVGGYDGTRWLDTILAWSPGAPPRVVGHLPTGLRYAAATFAGRRLIIAGGTTPAGASAAILSFDPASGSVTHLGALPHPLTHAAAAQLNGSALIVGGRRTLTGDQSRGVLAVDPATGSVRRVGRLPQPLSDAAAVTTGGKVIVAGGGGPGTTVASILEIAPG